MPVMEMGRQLPSVYLTRFNPADNVPMRISVLDTSRVLGIEYHWVDVPSLNLKGSYKCCSGVCCEAYGPRIQSYCVPIYVYVNPQQSTEGELQVWSLTKTVYQDLCSLISRYDLSQFDIEVNVHQQGYGRKTAITMVPGDTLRKKMSAELLEKIRNEVEDFYVNGEPSLVKVATADDWVNMLAQAGYNFQARQWNPGFGPQSQSGSRAAMAGATTARGAIGNVPRPSMGTQAAQPAPARASLPNRPAPAPIGAPVAQPQMQTNVQYKNVQYESNPQPVVAPVQPVPVQPVPVSPAPVQPVPVQPVPVSPAPVQPVPVQPAPVQSAPVNPVPPPPPNMVPGATEITGSELDSLLDGI